ncbi:MAG: methyltransferase domain-containing protein [Kiritimatiellae bacterium]|nr:methyltransferase domain-containing protein [Kiritimatiellia bacterium]
MIWEKWKQNFRKPGLWWGARLALRMMNNHHRALQEFAAQYFMVPEDGVVLDIGCGGGFLIDFLLRRSPRALVYGIDHSPLSVKQSLRYNRKAVKAGRVQVLEASVSAIPYRDHSFDLVTACETIYFWPDLAHDFGEVWRVLRSGGLFVICCDSCDPIACKKYTDTIEGMRVYTVEQLKGFLNESRFVEITSHISRSGKVCLSARKP